MTPEELANGKLEYSSGPVKLCSGCGRFMPIDDKRRLLPHNRGHYFDIPCTDETTMTPEELASETIKGILNDPAGIDQLRTFARPETWVRSSVSHDVHDQIFYDNALVQAAGELLVERKILKPDNRTHRGVGKPGASYYRLSRGWWNKQHKDSSAIPQA